MIQFVIGIFFVFVHSSTQNPLNSNPSGQIPAFKTPASPQDGPRSITEKNPPKNNRDLFGDLSSLTPCQKDCSSALMDAVGLMMMKSMSHSERYSKVCNSYNQSYSCIEEEKRCGNEDHKFFETVTSGVRYMCVDQSLAFQNTMECIDTQSSHVQGECEGECNTQNIIMNMVMRSGIAKQIQDQIMQGFPLETPEVPAVPQFDPNAFNELNQMSAEMCQMGECVLRCVKNKFNARCEGSAGALLAEVLVRPIASMQEELATITPILGLFMPKQCNYVHSAADLQQFRMDPSLDGDLRRMYAQKEAEKRANLTVTEVVKRPMPAIPKIVSPLNEATGGNGFPQPRIANPSQPIIKPVPPTVAPIRNPIPPTPRQILPASADSGAVEQVSQKPVRPTTAPSLKATNQPFRHLGTPHLNSGAGPQNPVQVSGSQWALADSVLRFPQRAQVVKK